MMRSQTPVYERDRKRVFFILPKALQFSKKYAILI